jgi:hypothetical protein
MYVRLAPGPSSAEQGPAGVHLDCIHKQACHGRGSMLDIKAGATGLLVCACAREHAQSCKRLSGKLNSEPGWRQLQ